MEEGNNWRGPSLREAFAHVERLQRVSPLSSHPEVNGSVANPEDVLMQPNRSKWLIQDDRYTSKLIVHA